MKINWGVKPLRLGNVKKWIVKGFLRTVQKSFHKPLFGDAIVWYKPMISVAPMDFRGYSDERTRPVGVANLATRRSRNRAFR